MSENIFLQEMHATVVFFDVRRFSQLAASLSPTDLAVALGAFYRHVEDHVQKEGGRVVKFISDAVLTLFPSVGGVDHAGKALSMLRTLTEQADAWHARNRELGLPELVYSAGAAMGPVLHGELGTDRLRAFDALGRPVTLAVKLAQLSTMRGVPHLVTGATIKAATADVPCIEVEGFEFADRPVRLYRVLGPQEATPE
jgi:adenylate cyclase